jgi:hypothetical protein
VATGLREYFESPRRRKRAIVLGVVAAAATTVGLLIAFDSNTAPSQETKMTRGKPVVAPKNPKAVSLAAGDREAVLDVTRRFLVAGVLGEHFKRSWDLTGPELHEGFTRKSWGPDNSTIVPFRYKSVRFRFDHEYSTEVGLELALYPKPHDKDYPSPMVFDTVVTRYGKGHGKRANWRVSYWAPAPGQAQVVQSNTPQSKLSLADKNGGSGGQLSSVWLAAPAVVFLLILLVPITIGVREWRRNRRARRDYEASLPDLSTYTSSSRPS